MNFLKEIEEKKWVKLEPIDEFNEKAIDCVTLKAVKEVFEKEWRSFWLKRKKEIEKEKDKFKQFCKEKEISKLYKAGVVMRMNNELSWIEKQLKEKEVK